MSCLNSNILQIWFGTPGYISPEIIENRPYNGFNADIFSLGQLLFNIVTGVFGFSSASTDDSRYQLIKNKQFNDYWESEPFINLNISDEFKTLFVKMVAYDPDERPTIDDIINGPWMQGINNLNVEQMVEIDNEIVETFHNRENQM